MRLRLAPRPLTELLLLFAVLSFARAAKAQATSGYRIAGTVVDGGNRGPLARATVTIKVSSGGSAEKVMTTKEDGRFSFENLPAGKFLLSVSRYGYVGQQYQEHGKFSTALVTGPQQQLENIRFAILREAVIEGVITDEANEPVRGAQVVLKTEAKNEHERSLEIERRGATDDEGRYRFANLPAGSYLVAAGATPWYALHVPRYAPAPSGMDGVTRDRPYDSEDAELDVAYARTYFPAGNEESGAEAIRVKGGDNFEADISVHPVAAAHLLFNAGGGSVSVRGWSNSSQMHLARMFRQVPQPSRFGVCPLGKQTCCVDTADKESSRSFTMLVDGDAELNQGNATDGGEVKGVVRMADGTSLQPVFDRARNVVTQREDLVKVGRIGEILSRRVSWPAGCMRVSIYVSGIQTFRLGVAIESGDLADIR